MLVLAGLLASCTPQPGTVPKHTPIEAPPKAKRVDLTPAQRSTTEASRGNAQASGSVVFDFKPPAVATVTGK